MDVRRNDDHKQRPIADKESQKWLTSLEAVIAARAACPDTQFVSIGDREADVYDLFLVERPVGVDLLVRAAQDRRIDHPDPLSVLLLHQVVWLGRWMPFVPRRSSGAIAPMQ